MPAAVLEEMNKLVEVAIQAAGAELHKGKDDFLPFGIMKNAKGDMQFVRWQKPNPPPPLEVLRGILLTIRGQARNPEVVAAVTVAPSAVPTKEGIDVKGIRCEVDHRKGGPRVVFVPYTREGGKVVTGTLVYLPGNNPVFADPQPAPAAAGK